MSSWCLHWRSSSPCSSSCFSYFGGFVSLLQFLCLFQSELYCGHSLMFRCWFICRVSWSLLVRKTLSMLFFLIGSSIYCCMHCSCANYKKAFAWTWFLWVPPSAVSICQSIIGKFRSLVNMIFDIVFPISLSFVLNSFKFHGTAKFFCWAVWRMVHLNNNNIAFFHVYELVFNIWVRLEFYFRMGAVLVIFSFFWTAQFRKKLLSWFS